MKALLEDLIQQAEAAVNAWEKDSQAITEFLQKARSHRAITGRRRSQIYISQCSNCTNEVIGEREADAVWYNCDCGYTDYDVIEQSCEPEDYENF